jgi:hypothetical protein
MSGTYFGYNKNIGGKNDQGSLDSYGWRNEVQKLDQRLGDSFSSG